jgi:small subunit ribosomal protein S17
MGYNLRELKMQASKAKVIKSRVGRVVKISGEKTVKVSVESFVFNKLYKKHVKRRRFFLVHDEKASCRVGDLVLIKEGRRVSKCKSWYVAKVLTGDGAKINPEKIEQAGSS